MSLKTCRHIMDSGNFCQSPALATRDFCYYHHEYRARRIRMARARARGEQWWLDLPPIEDLRSCQTALVRVIEAGYAKLIDPALAKILISGLRLAAGNFRSRYGWGGDSEYAVDIDSPYLTADPGFEARHDLPPNLDLDADPLKLFPMPQTEAPSSFPANGAVPQVDLTGAPFKPSFGLSGNSNRLAEILHRAETAVVGSPMQVTANDVELCDITNREGSEAAARRAGEMAREQRRRERRLQRARYEEIARNRNIQLAAEKMLRDEAAAAKASQSPAEQAAAKAATDQYSDRHAAEMRELLGSLSGILHDPPTRKPPQADDAPATSAQAASEHATGSD